MIRKVVSGGQTGVDRAALDVALELGIPCGGWCPRGRLAEDGPLEQNYPLEETPTSDYAQRTAWNVRDSDGTLLLYRDVLSGGTELTMRLAEKTHRPHLAVDLKQDATLDAITTWLDEHGIQILNIAGPRESGSPGIYRQAKDLLLQVLPA